MHISVKQLTKEYPKLYKVRDIYQYITAGDLPGKMIAEQEIHMEATNYIVVNELSFNITQID